MGFREAREVEPEESMLRALTLIVLSCGCSALLAPARLPAVVQDGSRAASPQMLWGRGGGSSVEQDFERRQEKLAQRQALAKSQPKGAVEVTFPQKGNKMVVAKQ